MTRYYRGGYGDVYPGHGFMGHGMEIVFCLLGMLLILALISLAVFLIIKHVKKNKGNDSITTDASVQPFVARALEILNERYAKGEIDDEEYQKKKSEILKI